MRKLGMQHYVECTMQISKFVWLSVYLRKCFSVWWFRLVWWMSFLSISIWFPCFTHSFASLIKSFLKKVISVRLSLFCKLVRSFNIVSSFQTLCVCMLKNTMWMSCLLTFVQNLNPNAAKICSSTGLFLLRACIVFYKIASNNIITSYYK